jgi:hypothetical protein
MKSNELNERLCTGAMRDRLPRGLHWRRGMAKWEGDSKPLGAIRMEQMIIEKRNRRKCLDSRLVSYHKVCSIHGPSHNISEGYLDQM